jgi:hypothetical protein
VGGQPRATGVAGSAARRLGGDVRALTARDRVLVDQIESAGAAVQRATTVWAAHQGSEIAELTAHSWSLRRSAPSTVASRSCPFGHLPAAFARLMGGAHARTQVMLVASRVDGAQPESRVDAPYAALLADPDGRSCSQSMIPAGFPCRTTT